MLFPLRLVVLPLTLTLGCLAAPREVETMIDLGPQKVEIDVRVKDIRTLNTDDLNQLRVFSEFASWNPEWINELPWAPTPTRFEYSGDGGRLDLTMHGSMARADFDRCARAASDAGVCADFPLELGKSGYAVRPEVLALKSLVIDGRQKSTWAADAGRIGYRVGLSGAEDKFIASGPSLARGFALAQAAPAVAAETVKKIDATEDVFARGTVADWVKELAALATCADEPWCRLRKEAVQRDQLRLVNAYLKARPEAGEAIRAAPSRHLDFFGGPIGGLVPKDTFAPIDELRLRVKYDVQVDRFHDDGWVLADPNPWAAVCRPDTTKKPGLKDLCARLGVTGKR